MDQLEGTLTSALARIDAAMFDLSARLEASLDFPDEGFHFVTREDVRSELGTLRDALERVSRDGRAGRLLREGSLVVITGRPNAGKSSLFNALVGASRAIVTEIPGTTRDVLTERVDICGVPITLVDTAGLREAADAIEAEGVARARRAHQIAALSLVVIDQSEPLSWS
jgi:tRNA modification GTPase